MPAKTKKMVLALDVVLQRARPLFVAFDCESSQKKRHRGKLFAKVVKEVCEAHGVMILDVKNQQTNALAEMPKPTKWDVADAIARLFPEIAAKLPPRRKLWESENDHIGLFMAVAVAVSAWDSFRRPQK